MNRICIYETSRKLKGVSACSDPTESLSISSPLISENELLQQINYRKIYDELSLSDAQLHLRSCWPEVSVTPLHRQQLSIPDCGTQISTFLALNEETGRLLKCYFDELETFYPCIDRVDFYARLSDLFYEHSTVEGNLTFVSADREWISLAALVCGMLCLGTYLCSTNTARYRNEACSQYASKMWHLESRRLLDLVPSWKNEPNGDILALHILQVHYLTILEKVGELTKTLAIALDIAFDLGLNDQSEQASDHRRKSSHQCLQWMTLCYLERRMALRCKRPLWTSDVSTLTHLCDPSNRASLSDHNLSMTGNQSSMPFEWALPACRTAEWFQYVEFLIQWCKLLTNAWDECFSLKASHHPALRKMVEADTLLMELETRLPSGLRWDVSRIPANLTLEESDRRMRLQLLILEVCLPRTFLPCY